MELLVSILGHLESLSRSGDPLINPSNIYRPTGVYSKNNVLKIWMQSFMQVFCETTLNNNKILTNLVFWYQSTTFK